MPNFFAIGINHENAPVNLREYFAYTPAVSEKILRKLKKRSLVEEVFYLTTCNRSELYAVPGQKLTNTDQLKDALFKDASHLTYTKKGKEAINQLFRVAASLDAMVVGETQILGQIKDAYFNAYKNGFTGPFINRTMLRAIYVAKKVRSGTDIAKGAISVASVAVNLAKRCLKNLSSSSVLVIGAGEMGALVVKQLKKEGVDKIIVVNRSWEKACLIAAHTKGEAFAWEDLSCAISKADIVISSTGSSSPIINKNTIGNRSFPLVLIDLGIPRDMAEDINELKEATLFNIDDLQNIARENNEYRFQAAKDAENIISQEVAKYVGEISHSESLAAIAMLNQKCEEIRKQELEKTLMQLPDLTPRQKDIISAGTKATISKIFNNPIREIKEPHKSRWEKDLLSDAIYKLFHLDEE